MISLPSETVRHLIACKYWREIMDSLNPNSPLFTNNSICNGRLFELLASVYLEFPVEFDARNDKQEMDHKLKLSNGTRKEYLGSWDDFLGYWSRLNDRNCIFPFKNVWMKNLNL
jgi:hypothetical protein